jgi:syringate O-demethylase
MAELLLEGPDALKLLTGLGVNSFANFGLDRAKQFVPCSPDGFVIGDVILFHLAENTFNLVGRIPALNWVRFHAETGGYNVKADLDDRTAVRKDPSRRRNYRFQIQGPNAAKVIERATGRPIPDVKFFHLAWTEIAGKKVRALRHGMAGQPGLELFGPWDDGEAVLRALVEAGNEFGMRQVGGRAYSSNTLES